MRIGVPTEIKPQEYRVGLIPASVKEFTSHGHEVYVQNGAGAGIQAEDAAYEAAGAVLLQTAEEVFATADMIVKVKEPQPTEWAMLREGQIIYTYLHLAPDPEQTKGLLESGAVAIAYETIVGRNGGLPLLAPMSEVAGRLSIQAAAEALTKVHNGQGLLLGGVPGVEPARVLILGGGIVGINAARMAMGLGADVTILDRSLTRIRYLDDMFKGQLKTRYSTQEAIETSIPAADVIIGSVLIPGANAPKLITKDMLELLKSRAVLVDVAIDQGGCFETSHPTTHAEPTFIIDDVIHYCVANMPGIVPVTSSNALNNATLERGLMIAGMGWEEATKDIRLKDGLNIAHGKIINEAVKTSFNG